MLKPCRSCTFAVDTSARRCPHCGAKHPTVKGLAAPDGEAAVLTRRIDALQEQLEALAACVDHSSMTRDPAKVTCKYCLRYRVSSVKSDGS